MTEPQTGLTDGLTDTLVVTQKTVRIHLVPERLFNTPSVTENALLSEHYLQKEQIDNNEYYEKNLADYGAISEDLFYSELYTSLGIADKKFSDKILLMGNPVQGYLRTVPLNGSVYVYDRRTKILIKGDNSDIEQGGPVFVQMRYGTANTLLVIRN